MPYVDSERLPEKKVPRPFERSLKVLLSPETDREVEDFTLLLSTLAPRGGCTDMHSHPTSGELMFFTSGTGEAWLEGEHYDLKPGVALYAPPGAEHKTLNTGEEAMQIVCVFIPPAPTDYIRSNIEEAGSAVREGPDDV